MHEKKTVHRRSFSGFACRNDIYIFVCMLCVIVVQYKLYFLTGHQLHCAGITLDILLCHLISGVVQQFCCDCYCCPPNVLFCNKKKSNHTVVSFHCSNRYLKDIHHTKTKKYCIVQVNSIICMSVQFERLNLYLFVVFYSIILL